MTSVKRLVRRLIHLTGYDLHRLIPDLNPAFQLYQGLEKFGVDLVFDVGANAGQFATDLRSVGYQGRIVSVEPLSAAHAQLTEHARPDRAWTVHPRCALGSRDQELAINVAGNSVSSSLLPMTEAHSSAALGSAYLGVECVPVSRLDTIAPRYLDGARAPFLKIDTQGYEWEVLEGAQMTIPRLRGVLCELSLVPLYEGQHLWLDVIRRLETDGFTLWAIQRGFTDQRDGRTLQVDAIFFRT
jgi:FkbM family methyltransferase